jgi:hypothetical protein
LSVLGYYPDFASSYLSIFPNSGGGRSASFVITILTYNQNITICGAIVNKKDLLEGGLYEKEGYERNGATGKK